MKKTKKGNGRRALSDQIWQIVINEDPIVAIDVLEEVLDAMRADQIPPSRAHAAVVESKSRAALVLVR